MPLQFKNIAVGNLQDDVSGNNYAANKAVYILNLNNTLAQIFSDEAGTIPIVQDGVNNVTGARGVFGFWVEAGDYFVQVGANKYRVSITGADYFNNRIDETVDLIVDSVAGRGAYYPVGSFEAGFTYTDINQVGTFGTAPNITYYVYTGGLTNLNHPVPAGTDPTLSSDYKQVTYNSAEAITNANGGSVQDAIDFTPKKISLGDAVSEDGKVGLSYIITDRGNAMVTVVDSSDSGGLYAGTMASGRKLRVDDSDDRLIAHGGKVESIGSPSFDNSPIISYIYSFHKSVSLPVTKEGEFVGFLTDCSVISKANLAGAGGWCKLLFDSCSLICEDVNFNVLKNIRVERIGSEGPAIIARGDTLGFRRNAWFDVHIEGSTGGGVEFSGGWLFSWFNPILQGCQKEALSIVTGAYVTGMNSFSLFGGEIQGNDVAVYLERCKQFSNYGCAIEGNRIGYGIGNNATSVYINAYHEANTEGTIAPYTKVVGGNSGILNNMVIDGGSYFLKGTNGSDQVISNCTVRQLNIHSGVLCQGYANNTTHMIQVDDAGDSELGEGGINLLKTDCPLDLVIDNQCAKFGSERISNFYTNITLAPSVDSSQLYIPLSYNDSVKMSRLYTISVDIRDNDALSGNVVLVVRQFDENGTIIDSQVVFTRAVSSFNSKLNLTLETKDSANSVSIYRAGTAATDTAGELTLVSVSLVENINTFNPV